MGPEALPGLVLLVGAIILVALLGKAALTRVGVPAMIGYLLIGVALRLAGDTWGVVSAEAFEVLAFLGEVGVALLLFRVGFETDLVGLLRQLGSASVIWIVSVAVSGIAGFLAARLLGFGPVPSLFAATALTATSVGVALEVWREQGRLRSDLGEVLLDVAELDDISAVVLMGLLLAVAPTLANDGGAGVLPLVVRTAALYLFGALLLGAACLLFARFAERPVTRFLQRVERGPDPLLSMTAIGLIVAALAAFLGFSIAIGAFFGGLMFARDVDAFERDVAFETLYEVFVPFFFVGIGLMIPLAALQGGLVATAVLLLAAVVGKLFGVGLPASRIYGREAGWLLGLSMVPRAEIGLIVMRQGLELGAWAVPLELFAAIAAVAALTSLGAPFPMRRLLRRPHPPEGVTL